MMRMMVTSPTPTPVPAKTDQNQAPAATSASTTMEPQKSTNDGTTTCTTTAPNDSTAQQDIGAYDMDGSVPSWAFAQLGSFMAMSSFVLF